MLIYDETNRSWMLGSQIASGGEGTVYRLTDSADFCAKIYHSLPLSKQKREKLEALRAMPHAARRHAAIPVSLAGPAPKAGEPHSVIMPMVGGRDIYELYNPECRRSSFGEVTFEFLVAAAKNLVVAFEQLHAEGIVVGDVNERNIKVRPDATLTFIDCDSFQFRQNGRLFTSDVGTPMWTPPELQGLTVHGLERTQNHDLFGLAQLVFLLLFAGRYPFAGRPVSDIALTPEAAIKRHAFAYDPAPPEHLLAPPPGAPPFDSVPGALRELFVKSFRKGSELPAARPCPAEWGVALGSLSKNLVQCAVRRSHVYWNGALQCPWCALLKGWQLDLFPGTPHSAAKPAGETREHLQLATRLLDLAFSPMSLVEPSRAVLEACIQQARSSGKRSTPWYSSIHIFGISLESGRKKLELLKCDLDTVLKRTRWVCSEAAGLPLQYRAAADDVMVRARNLAARLRDTANQRFAALRELQAEWREHELDRHLKRYFVSNIVVPGVGESRRRTLLSNGIVTAAEVREHALLGLPGFGGGMVAKLLEWRRECGLDFRFDASAPLPAVFAQKLSETTARRVGGMIKEGGALEAEFARLTAEYGKRFGALQTEYEDLCKRRAVLESKISALERRRA